MDEFEGLGAARGVRSEGEASLLARDARGAWGMSRVDRERGETSHKATRQCLEAISREVA